MPPAQALAVAGIITLGAMLDHGLFYGLGRPGAWLGYAVVVDTATVATTAVAVRWGLVGVAVGFVVVAVARDGRPLGARRARLGLPCPGGARPFVTVLVPTVVTTAVGSAPRRPGRTGGGSPPSPWRVRSVAVVRVVLRACRAGIVRDGLGVLPVPERYARRIRRWLLLDPRGRHRATRGGTGRSAPRPRTRPAHSVVVASDRATLRVV